MQKKTNETYQSPSARRLEVKTRTVLCDSGTNSNGTQQYNDNNWTL